MSKLYELTSNYQNLLDLLDLEEVDKEMLDTSLNALEGDIASKVEATCKIIKNLENEATGLKNEAERLSTKKKAIENRITGIKEYLFSQVSLLEGKKVKGLLFSVGIQKNPPSVNILDSNKIPMSYVVPQELVFDKKAILKDLKAEIKVEGCEIKNSESLRIK